MRTEFEKGPRRIEKEPPLYSSVRISGWASYHHHGWWAFIFRGFASRRNQKRCSRDKLRVVAEQTRNKVLFA